MKLPAPSVCLVIAVMLAVPVRLSAATTAIDVVSYRVRLTIEPSARTLEGVADVTFRNVCDGDLHEIALDLRDLVVDKVEMEGLPLSFSPNDSGLVIHFEHPLCSRDTGTVTIWYHGCPTSDIDHYAGVRFGPRTVWAHPQSHRARYVAMLPHWLPCNNLFSDKAIFDLTFDTPVGWRAAAMGTLVHESENDGRQRAQWVLRDPLHPAGAGWAVGNYEVYRDTIRGIPFHAYVWPAELPRAQNYFRTIDTMVAVFEREFGDYPAEKIGFALTDSNSCEEHTMIELHKESLVGSASTLEAHELAHHWWGNSVTPADIRENWLSEGFAMYGEILLRDVFTSMQKFDDIMRYYTTYYRVSIAPAEGALPLYDYLGAGSLFNYPSVIYIRGAVALNMLRHVMGNERYRAGIRDYFSRARGQNVTSAMFQEVMEEHLDQSLTPFFQQWVYSGGWPMLRITRLGASPTGGFQLAVEQHQQADRGWPLFDTPVEIDIYTKSSGKLPLRRSLQPLAQDIWVFDDVPDSEVESWRIDPGGWLLHEAQTVTAVELPDGVATAPMLEAPYPQPMRRTTPMALQPFTLPAAATVLLEVRDVLGRRLRTIANGDFAAGRHVVALNLTDLPPGCYRILLRVAGHVESRALLVQ